MSYLREWHLGRIDDPAQAPRRPPKTVVPCFYCRRPVWRTPGNNRIVCYEGDCADRWLAREGFKHL